MDHFWLGAKRTPPKNMPIRKSTRKVPTFRFNPAHNLEPKAPGAFCPFGQNPNGTVQTFGKPLRPI